jgi:hypothetical protein
LFVASSASLILGAVALSGATLVRVVMVITVLLVLPLTLAREFEPAKKRKPSGD